jgi:tRNA(fMet)-specific endonuclease VapC
VSVRYLVDNDWVIQYLNADAKIMANLDARRADGIGISVISIAELYDGAFYARDPAVSERKLRDFLAGMSKFPIDEDTRRIFGRERGRLRAARKIIGDFDLMIAATAIEHSLTLLTNNRRHFDRIEALRIESVRT